MTTERQYEISRQLESFPLFYQKNGEAIAVNFRDLTPELNKQERYTHLIHPYPAKLLANIPFFFLSTNTICPSKGIVLDPFCGTGTVLLEAILTGRNAYGADANPLAELITNVKTNYLPKEELRRTLEGIMKETRESLLIPFIPQKVSIWYSENSLRQLARLQFSISNIKDRKQKSFFELCFSCVARKVSYADPSISVPVHWNPERFCNNPQRKSSIEERLKLLRSVDVYDKFESICKANIERLETLNGAIIEGVESKIVANDARNLGLPDNSVDLILTSPPYAGAQKYIRASWLNLYWLNKVNLEEIRELKKHNIGREDYRKAEVYEFYTGIEPADEVLRELYGIGMTQRAFII